MDSKMKPQQQEASQEELDQLNKHLDKAAEEASGCAPLVSVLCIFGAILAIVLSLGGDASSWVSGIFLAVILVPCGVVGLVASSRQDKDYHHKKEELKQRKIEIVYGEILEKKENHGKYSASYAFVVGDETFDVDITAFTRYDEGDIVRLHVGPTSRTVLKIEKIENTDKIDSGETMQLTDIVKTYWLALDARDWGQAWSFLDEDFEADWPVTKEHWNRAEFIKVNQEYPGNWQIEIERVEALNHGVLSIVRVRIEEQYYYATSVFEFRDNKVKRVTEYWADGAEPPEWRKS
jgi:hypothetical protein